jgi:small subunit ribosomal protein S8
MNTTTDPIADMLTRIRNAVMAKHDFVLIPASKMKLAITRVLKEEGFISDYEVIKDMHHRVIKIRLRYFDRKTPVLSGLKRVSKPSLRTYARRSEIPRVYGGLGVAILSTPKGVMTGQQAWRQHLGGEILCHVW